MKHFIMSVKHRERCTELADTETERVGRCDEVSKVTESNH